MAAGPSGALDRKPPGPNRPIAPHGGWGARRGHVTHGGAGREGLGAQRDEGTKPVLRRRLLGAEHAPVRAPTEDAAAAATAVLWPSLQKVPASLRCSGGERV